MHLSIYIKTLNLLDPSKLSYIAAAIDCDGSIYVQIIPQKEGLGFRVSFPIQISQHSNQMKFLQNIQNLTGCGKVSRRKDSNMADWKVSTFDEGKQVAKHILPYLTMKNQQVVLLLEILTVYKNLPQCKNPQKAIQRAEGIYTLLYKIDQLANLNGGPNRKNDGSVAFNLMQERGFLLDKNYP